MTDRRIILRGLLTSLILLTVSYSTSAASPSRNPVFCRSEVDVGDSPGGYERLFRTTVDGQFVCPFTGRRAVVLSPMSRGDCSAITFKGVRAKTKSVSEKKFYEQGMCLPMIAPTRKASAPGVVQVIQVRRPGGGQKSFAELQFAISRVMWRGGLPVSAYDATAGGRSAEDFVETYCFEMMPTAGPIRVKTELAKMGVDWPVEAKDPDGGWSNCPQALAALAGVSTCRGENCEAPAL